MRSEVSVIDGFPQRFRFRVHRTSIADPEDTDPRDGSGSQFPQVDILELSNPVPQGDFSEEVLGCNLPSHIHFHFVVIA